MIIEAMQTPLHGAAPLTHLGVIRVEGEDAAKFLHGQLTQDFALLGLSEARLAGFCSAKGRMQASFIGVKRSPTEVLLICSRDLLAPTLKRLSMFVMRAKAKLSDASDDYTLLGLVGDAQSIALESIAPEALSAWAKFDIDQVSVLGLYPADGVARALWLAPVSVPLPKLPILSAADWAWTEVRSGIATVSAPVMELFVPQMLNYESVGGVNFKKGCYPGQEVVARSQFRGTLKRRAYLGHTDAPLNAGDEVFESGSPDQPCGTVVQAAVSPAGGFDAIVSLQVSAFEAGNLHLGSASGPTLTASPPPYPLLADI
jgi:tRNA-modifying protein YgfZ